MAFDSFEFCHLELQVSTMDESRKSFHVTFLPPRPHWESGSMDILSPNISNHKNSVLSYVGALQI